MNAINATLIVHFKMVYCMLCEFHFNLKSIENVSIYIKFKTHTHKQNYISFEDARHVVKI